MSPRQLPEPSPVAGGGRVELRIREDGPRDVSLGPGPSEPGRATIEPAGSASVSARPGRGAPVQETNAEVRTQNSRSPTAEPSGSTVARSDLEGATPLAVRYDARWFTASGVFEGSAEVDTAGEATCVCADAGAPGWLLDWTAALLRLVARDHAAGAPWPRRLTRWRNEPQR